MSGSNWYLPPQVIGSLPNTDARTQSITPYGSNMLAVGGFASTANGATMFSLDLASFVWSALLREVTPNQYVDTAAKAGGALITIDDQGYFQQYLSSGLPLTDNILSMASGAFLSVYSNATGNFGVTCTGTIYNAATGAVAGSFLATPNSEVVNQAIALPSGNASGLVPATNQIGAASPAGAYTGTQSGPSGPTKLSCFAASETGSYIAAGGNASATLGSSGQNYLVQNPVNTTLLLGVSNTIATIFGQSASNSQDWVPETQLTGITSASNYGAWSVDGTQAILSDSTNGKLQILDYVAGVLSISQTLTLTGIGSIAPANDGTYLLACAANEVAVFEFSGTSWSQNTGNTISLAGAACVTASNGTLGDFIFAGSSGGVSILHENTGTWAVSGSTIATTFAVTAVATDPSNNIYAAGAGHLDVFNSSGALTGSGTFAGSGAAAIIVSQAQVLILDTVTNNLFVMGANGGTSWTTQNTYSAGGAISISEANSSIFLAGNPPTIMEWEEPYTVKDVPTGYIGLYNGVSWTTIPLGPNKVPSAAIFDSNSNSWIACRDNSLYEISPAGAITTQTVVPNYPGTSTPMGVSSLQFANGHLYAGCSLFGGVVQVF